MELAKKNIISIMFGVIALLAIISLFWPLEGMKGDVEKEVNKRKATYTEVDNLRNKTRQLPVLVLDNPEPAQLEQFPNPSIIQLGKTATEQVHAQSLEMLKAAVEMNRHDPITPEALPAPSGSAPLKFRDDYNKAIRQTLPQKVLRSTMPPTDDEMIAEAQRLWETEFRDRIILIGGNAANKNQIEKEFHAAADLIPDRMRKERAEQHLVYMDPSVITANPDVGPGSNPSAVNIWFAQQTYWVQEDVARAIVAANTKGMEGDPSQANITNAPVKEIISLQIPPGAAMYRTAGAGFAGPTGAPGGGGGEEAPPPTAGPTGKAFNVSPTGRVSNPLYDVIHFSLVLRVDANRIPAVLEELKRNRLLTVLEMDVASIDSAQARKDGFVYGDAPIVELTLQCEALYLREWTKRLMPQAVRRMLGVTDDQPAGEGTGEQAAATGPAGAPVAMR